MKRQAFLAAAAVVTLAADACARSGAQELQLVEAAADFDYPAFVKRVDIPADVRQVWDIDGYEPNALGAMKSAFNGYQFGFRIPANRIAMAAVLHGAANCFAYDDSMWAKYSLGAAFGIKDPSGNVVTTNIFYHARSKPNAMVDPNNPQGMYQDATLEALQRRGVLVFVCHTAAAEQARSLARNGSAPTGSNPERILADLLTHLMPGVSQVPSGVATVGLLQSRFRYAYTQTS